MRKLKLNLDGINVQSFHVTDEAHDGRGTVHAHSHASCPYCDPSSMTNPTGCGTCAHATICYVTCDASCDTCAGQNTCGCPNTGVTDCEYTCWPDPC